MAHDLNFPTAVDVFDDITNGDPNVPGSASVIGEDPINTIFGQIELMQETYGVNPMSLQGFAEDAEHTQGLVWGYFGGRVRNGSTVRTIATGTITLTDNATNYVYYNWTANAVQKSTSSWPANSYIPMATIVTLNAAITGTYATRDMRAIHEINGGVLDHSDLVELDYASAGHTGFEPTVAKGNLTEATSSVLTIGSGTGAVIGSGTTIQVKAANTSQSGYLSDTDWNLFTNKGPYHGVLSRATNPLPTHITSTTFTLGATANPITYYYQGTKVIVSTNKTATLDDGAGGTTSGIYYVYFNAATGNILATKTHPGISDTANVIIASIIWKSPDYGLVQDERHAYNRNTPIHAYLHYNVGARYHNDGGLVLTHNGGTGAAATFSTTAGYLWDEDIFFYVPASSAFPTANACRFVYQNGATSYTFDSVTSTVPFKRGGNNLPVVIDSSNGYAVTELSSATNRYINFFVYGTLDNHTPIYIMPETVGTAIVSANGYTSIANARAVKWPNLYGMGLSHEMKPLYRLIVKANGQVQPIDTTQDDYRLVSSLPMGSGFSMPTAAEITVSPSGNITATTVQTGMEQLDGLITAKVADAINDGTTTIAPSQNAVFDALALRAPLASPAFTTQISTPSIVTASGALGITPASGSNLNVTLGTTGDFAVNTNQLYVDTSAGSVGIGTSAPLAKLSVGAGSLTDANLPIQISTSGGTSVSYYSVNVNGGYGLLMGYSENPSDVAGVGAMIRNIAATPLNFLVNANTVAMKILADGKVGIGTTAPKSKLDVYGSMSVGTTYAGTTAAPAQGAIIEGNVGIGTSAPGALLHLKGANTAYRGQLTIEDTNYTQITMYNGASAEVGAWYHNIGENISYFGAISTGGKIQFLTGNDTHTMRLDSSGNVGIGTTSFPTSSVGNLTIKNGTAPSEHLDNTITIYSVDSSDSLSTLGLYLEQDVEDVGTFTPTKKIKIKINGIEYWLQLDPVA